MAVVFIAIASHFESCVSREAGKSKSVAYYSRTRRESERGSTTVINASCRADA